MSEVGGRGRTSERVDQIICESVHLQEYAKTADCAQGKKCQNGICHIGMFSATGIAMEIAQIRTLMKERGFNQADLANLLGIDPTAVSKRLTGKRAFKYDEMRKVEAWLGQAPSAVVEGSDVRMLPIIGQVAAGSWREAIEQPLGHMPVRAKAASPNAVVLEVQGDSMDLEIEDGGYVVVDMDDKSLFPGRLFVVLNGEGEATFKQFEVDPFRLVPRSTNPQHTTILIGDGQPFTVLGRVVSLIRER
ncbi:XRE family transcriptional regulator [Sphingomonas sp. S-NIH.Pt1_0416]|uniref:LexA family protein n=1 Tax=Sphingomonas sp. S-NIH.Pt1_0416 TaxID=1920123 RepID=UPI0013E069A3|nr:XRE family transcriptional regulator [Sphingomonas sp. S-NIH.Pt1_0416]